MSAAAAATTAHRPLVTSAAPPSPLPHPSAPFRLQAMKHQGSMDGSSSLLPTAGLEGMSRRAGEAAAAAAAAAAADSRPTDPDDVGLPVLELFLRRRADTPAGGAAAYESQLAALYAPDADYAGGGEGGDDDDTEGVVATLAEFIGSGALLPPPAGRLL